MAYDLEERTALFAESIISLAGQVKKTVVTLPIISQLVRSGTSIGANYREANGASSKRDFRNKIYICKKEAKETQYWLRILAAAQSDLLKRTASLSDEVRQLILIFTKIVTTIDKGGAVV